MERTLGASWSFCRMKNNNYGGVVLRIPSPRLPHLLLQLSLSLSLSFSLPPSLFLSRSLSPSSPYSLILSSFKLVCFVRSIWTDYPQLTLIIFTEALYVWCTQFRNGCSVVVFFVFFFLTPNLPLSSSTPHCAAQTGLSFSVSPRPSNKVPPPLHGFCSGAASMFLAPYKSRRLTLAPPAFVLRQA